MLRITIELLPFGNESESHAIGVGFISNQRAVSTNSCDYRFSFTEEPWQGRSFSPLEGQLRSWPRNDHGVWEIVHAALTVGLAPNIDPTADDGRPVNGVSDEAG